MFKVSGFGFRVSGLGCRVQGAGFRVQGSGFRVQGFTFLLFLLPPSGLPPTFPARRATLSPFPLGFWPRRARVDPFAVRPGLVFRV